jgi:hypothetical protein
MALRTHYVWFRSLWDELSLIDSLYNGSDSVTADSWGKSGRNSGSSSNQQIAYSRRNPTRCYPEQNGPRSSNRL